MCGPDPGTAPCCASSTTRAERTRSAARTADRSPRAAPGTATKDTAMARLLENRAKIAGDSDTEDSDSEYDSDD